MRSQSRSNAIAMGIGNRSRTPNSPRRYTSNPRVWLCTFLGFGISCQKSFLLDCVNGNFALDERDLNGLVRFDFGKRYGSRRRKRGFHAVVHLDRQVLRVVDLLHFDDVRAVGNERGVYGRGHSGGGSREDGKCEQKRARVHIAQVYRERSLLCKTKTAAARQLPFYFRKEAALFA